MPNATAISAAALLAATLLLPASLRAQIPATSPTQSSVSQLPSAQPRTAQQPAAPPLGAPLVLWTNGNLTIQGKGNTLAIILREVTRATGMKVTGGIPDERVFAGYGPGTASDVIAQLFDGIRINVLLLNSAASKPTELILTARQGGVSPPIATAAPLIDSDDPSLGTVPVRVQQRNLPPPTDAAPAAQPSSPNAVRTPQDIFDELRRRQQQSRPPQ